MLKQELEGKWGKGTISEGDVLSAAMYGKVFDSFKSFQARFGAHTDKLPTRAFLVPLHEDEELEVKLNQGVITTIKYKAVGEQHVDHSTQQQEISCSNHHPRCFPDNDLTPQY